MHCRYVKAVASVLLVLGILTGAANVWCLGPINQQYIPKVVRQAEVVLERKASPSLHSPPFRAYAACCPLIISSLCFFRQHDSTPASLLLRLADLVLQLSKM